MYWALGDILTKHYVKCSLLEKAWGLRYDQFWVYESIWWYISVDGGIWRYMEVYEGIWRYMKVSGGI